MEYISTTDGAEGVAAMAHNITDALAAGKKVLWLLCGGSNIPLSARAMGMIRTHALGNSIQNLTVGLTDERYGEVGHKDSNWQQLTETSFNFELIESIPILVNLPLQETVDSYATKIAVALANADVVIAQFGMGADGHVAGMLPHMHATEETKLVFGYEAQPFTRISITPPVFAQIDSAYIFVFGESKRDAVTKLKNEILPLEEEPCQILKQIPDAHFYSDLL